MSDNTREYLESVIISVALMGMIVVLVPSVLVSCILVAVIFVVCCVDLAMHT